MVIVACLLFVMKEHIDLVLLTIGWTYAIGCILFALMPRSAKLKTVPFDRTAGDGPDPLTTLGRRPKE
jgi:hypothetical protein